MLLWGETAQGHIRVGGFEAMQVSCFDAMRQRGLVLASGAEALALLG